MLLITLLQAVIGQTPRDARIVTKCEALLLKTYGLHVPEVVEQAGNHDPDDIFESILRQYHPAVLTEKYGNCFYREVSRAFRGVKSAYLLLSVYSFGDSTTPITRSFSIWYRTTGLLLRHIYN